MWDGSVEKHGGGKKKQEQKTHPESCSLNSTHTCVCAHAHTLTNKYIQFKTIVNFLKECIIKVVKSKGKIPNQFTQISTSYPTFTEC